MKDNILNKYYKLQDINWPPTSEELQEDLRAPSKSLCIFLETLIKYNDHSTTEKQARLFSSVTQDIIFAVTRGKVMQRKHFLLALGVHSLTGSRKIIDIVHKLGHCICYNLMSDIETDQPIVLLVHRRKVTYFQYNHLLKTM